MYHSFIFRVLPFLCSAIVFRIASLLLSAAQHSLLWSAALAASAEFTKSGGGSLW
jgi:hypothetical protein